MCSLKNDHEVHILVCKVYSGSLHLSHEPSLLPPKVSITLISNIRDWLASYETYIDGIMLQVHFYIWLLPWNIMSVRFIHVLGVVQVHLFCFVCSFFNLLLWSPMMWIYHSLLICCLVDWWTSGFSCKHSGTPPFGGHMYLFLLSVCTRVGLLGHRVCTCVMSVSIQQRALLSKVTIPISTPPTRRTSMWVPVASYCPKHTLNATTSSQGRTGNPQGQQRKTRNKLKPPIKWNLNRKPVLFWGQSQYRLLWDAVGMGEGLDLGPTKQRSWTRVPLSKESPPDCKRSQLRLCFSLPLLRLKGSAL